MNLNFTDNTVIAFLESNAQLDSFNIFALQNIIFAFAAECFSIFLTIV